MTDTRNTTGWTAEPCENTDCEETTHLFPPVGTLVSVVAKTNAREVGEDATFDVAAGACGVVEGYVAEWHDVHVRFLHDLNLWIDPDLLQTVTHRDNSTAPTPKGEIATAAQMNALPVGSRVKDREGDVWERDTTGWSTHPGGVRRTSEGVFDVYGHCFPGTLIEQHSDPYFRTLVTYEVLTIREAFNGDAEYLAAEVANGTASAKLVLRAVEQLLPTSVAEKLIEHGEDLDFFGEPVPDQRIKARLEDLRSALRSESISYGELHELQGLAEHIEPGDVELLEPAGVPEFPQEGCAYCATGRPVSHTHND
jgi:hypothetical protein